jgi:hypothetical protein
MTVATGLNRDSGYRLVRQVCRHDGCSAAEKGEGILHHSRVTLGDELRNTLCIALGENGDCASRTHAFQIGVSLSRDMLPKFLTSPESLGARGQIDGP